MSDPPTNSTGTTEPMSVTPAPSAADAERCLGCVADLSRLPPLARYCPRCGVEIHLGTPPDVEVIRMISACGGTQPRRAGAVPHTDMPPIYVKGRWRQLDPLTGSWQRIRAATPRGPSLILEGYGNALYKLGRRYETAVGAAQNVSEAERCYCKAARLGNLWALARLAARWFA